MIEKTLSQIEAKIRNAASIKEEKKTELLNLLSTLDSEIDELAKTRGEEAQSIAKFAEASAHEATRREQNPQLLDLSLQGLSKSVNDLEVSHPELARIANSICVTLSNLGI